MLNYCNFEVYLLITSMFLSGESFVFYCAPLFLSGEPLRVMGKSPQNPSVVSRVISTLINIILSCLSLPREVSPVSFSGADLVEGNVK